MFSGEDEPMRDKHAVLRELILAYEELSNQERAQVDAHLAACAGCRELLTRLQAVEREAASLGDLPPLGDPTAEALNAPDERAACESLQALRQELGLEGAATQAPAAVRPLRKTIHQRSTLRDLFRPPMLLRWLAPMGIAAALVLVVAPWRTGPTIRDVTLQPAEHLRGATTPAPTAEPERPWHTGEAFFLQFHLERAGAPVVFHLDPEGSLNLLYPDPRAQPQRFAAGSVVQLPAREEDSEWVFEGPPGAETFLISLATRADFDPALLLQDAQSAVAPLEERAMRVQAVQNLLVKQLGETQRIEVAHVP